MSRLQALRDRASLLAAARRFFAERHVLEVDCPQICRAASIDLHIDLFEVSSRRYDRRFLHTSPEYAMKRLLAEGIGDIYQLGHVFRDDEQGLQHNPEFTMAEWYRLGFTLDRMIGETADFARLFLGPLPLQTLTYDQALQLHAGATASSGRDELLDALQRHGLTLSPDARQLESDGLLQLLFSAVVEPALDPGRLTAIRDYPASQAALACLRDTPSGQVAERFELYAGGLELANGYRELVHPEEQERRFFDSNRQRQAAGKEALPIDDAFLQALAQGLPDCCGVAAGFDRLLMLHRKAARLSEVLPFDWDTC